MPGRKSNVSTASVGPEEVTQTPTAAEKKASKDKDGLSVDDLSLPKSMVARLAKGVLPANTQIHKDALLALHKSATVFVSYIAANSNDNAQASGKKTVQPQDVFNALKDTEYESFLPRLEAELKKYNEMQCDKRNTYRRKVKEEKAAAEANEGDVSALARDGTENGSKNGDVGDEAAERPAKRLKGENGTAVRQDEADDADDDDEGDEDQEADEQEDEAEEEVADSEAEEDQSDDDQPMEDALEEQEDEEDERRGMRDEALDDPDSD